MQYRYSRFDRYVPAVEATVTPHDNTMTTDRIESFLRLSGFGVEAVEEIRPDLPRWLRYLQERGVTRIPSSPITSQSDMLASSLLDLLALQASLRKDPTAKALRHYLRDLTGTRPYKG